MRSQGPRQYTSTTRAGTKIKSPVVLKETTAVARLDKRLKKLEREERSAEIKWFDQTFSSTVTYAAPVLLPICLMTQGDTQNNRQGNKVSPTSIQLKMNILGNSSQVSGLLVRCVIFKDRSPDGTMPTFYGQPDSVYEQNGTISDPSLFNRNRNMLEKYDIIYDKVFIPTPMVHDGTDNQVGIIHVVKYKKLSGDIRYKGNAGNVSDLSVNGYFFGFMTNITAFPPSVIAITRLNFRDN